MNIQFSFRRFWHVLVWTLVYHWRQLLTLFSVAVIAFATFEMFACIQARNDYAYKVSLMHENETVLINSALRGMTDFLNYSAQNIDYLELVCKRIPWLKSQIQHNKE